MSLMRMIKVKRKQSPVEQMTPEQRIGVVTAEDAATHLEQHKVTAARLMDTLQEHNGVHLGQLSALYNALSGVEHYSKGQVADGVIVYGNIKLQRKRGVVGLTNTLD
jgi:hypothetical protein